MKGFVKPLLYLGRVERLRRSRGKIKPEVREALSVQTFRTNEEEITKPHLPPPSQLN